MPQELKTLQLGSAWFPEHSGGLERYYFDLFNRLPEQGILNRGLVVGSHNVSNNEKQEILAFANPSSPLLHRWYKARYAAKNSLISFKPNLICIHFALYGFPAKDLLGDLPVVVHFQGPWARESALEDGKNPSIIKHYIEKTVYRRADRLIVLSESFKEILAKDYKISPEKITVLPGAINTHAFNSTLNKTEAREKLKWEKDRPIIFAVRRLSRRMGLENLLTAMVEVIKKYPEVMLIIAGKGSMATDLVKMSKDIGIENNVSFLGFVADEDLPLAYRAADFSVVPSISLEGFGLVTVESLAAGTPVLVTPVGGLPEIIRPFASEWVTENTSATAIAKSIVGILSGTIKMPTSIRCQEYAQRYDWNNVTPAISKIYRDTIL